MNQTAHFPLSFFTLVFTVTLCSCSTYSTISNSQSTSPLQLPENSSTTYVYECGNDKEFTVNIKNQTAWVFLPDETLSLPARESASGAKFSDQNTTFWTKGQEALLQIKGENMQSCRNNPRRAVWEHAKLSGVDFRAVGNEPGWYLEIYPEIIHYVGDYGEVDELFPRPEPVNNNRDHSTTYSTANTGNKLQLQIEATPCYDSMSEDKYSSSVTIWFNDSRYMGCGNPLH